MKRLFIFLILLTGIVKSSAQITNIKAGLWSDNTTWSSNSIPVFSDVVLLNFDITVNINAICKSLSTNGHNVTVQSGVTLTVAGNNNANTDTSVIFTKKTIFSQFGDSSVQIFRNNKIDGNKGYLVKQRYNQLTPTTTKFTYNNFGQLSEIATSRDTDPSEIRSKVALTWDKNKIVHIKWDDAGSYGIDRYYDYSGSNDTLSIRYKQNIGRNLYLDSAAVTIFTDTGLNKVYRIFKGGEFDYTNIFFNAKGVFNNERTFQYSGNNITSVKYYGETYYNTTPYPYSFEVDSSICNFARQSQVNTFLSDMEKTIFGKEFKMLCYDQTDSINWILDEYFTTGNWLSASNPEQPTQDYFQFESVFNASVDPITGSTINYVVRRDGLISDQQSGYLYKKLVYTLDSANRIKSIKEYNTQTNALVTEFQFTYP